MTSNNSPHDSFIQELDALFGKDAQKKLRQEQKATRVKQSPSEFARSLAAEFAFAETVARNFRERDIFTPTARVTEVIHQQCTRCGETHSYISGEYIRFSSPRLKCKVESRREARVAEDWLLPLILQESSQTTHQCYSCLLEEQKADQFLEVIQRTPDQLEMFP